MRLKELVILILIILGCQNNPKLDNSLLDQYFYLTKDKYGKINSEGKVLLHLSISDSILIEPMKISSLHVAPDWERKEFPHEVLNFPNLRFLWIAMRDFKLLPKEIIKLKHLKHLNLQNSGLQRLPENIGELKELEELVLLFSDIEILPHSICDLSKLKKLHLGGSKISQLPSCLDKLQNLEEFILFYEDESDFSELLKSDLKQLQKLHPKCKFLFGKDL